jgi:large subunit ribosomal protein L19
LHSLFEAYGKERYLWMLQESLFINNIKTVTKMADLMKIAEEAFATGKELPAFSSGDTVSVFYKIKEGNKERIQQYRGVVIRISGHGTKKRFTVRKISDGVGVERIFPMESPFIDKVEVNKQGRVRRARLYYLRNLTGKAARIREKVAAKAQ